MTKPKISCLIASATVVVALILYAAYVLVGICPDVLLTAQDRNVFTGDSMFFSEQMSRPFGIFQYVGGFLTQFFFHPALGASLLIALWLASAFVGIKAFRLKGLWRSLMIVPPACLLASETDLGYWVYCLNIPGYWFSQSVAFLCILLLLWAANSTPRRFRIAWYIIVGFALFPLFGWTSYLFALCLALSQFKRDTESKTFPSWIDGVGIALAFVSPLIFRALFYEATPNDFVFDAGFPFFKTASDTSMRPVVPFFVLVGATLVASFGRVLPELKKVPACIAYLVVGIASSVAVWTTIFKDQNYLYEMQMVQATERDDWQAVISVAEKTMRPSRTMVMLKNIALLNTGELCERSFELSNDGVEIYNPDSLNLNLMHIASPLIYYNHGEVNYAIRWCVEFAVPYGFSPYHLKLLTRCAEATGEKKLAQRYLTRLHNTIFYADWQPTPTSAIVKELQAFSQDALDNDDNSCERYIIRHFSETHNDKSPHCVELNLLYSMIIREPKNFWESLYDYLTIHKGGTMPTACQEAYCLFMDQARLKFPYKVNISPETIERYKTFIGEGDGLAQNGLTEEGVREALREKWAGTYWWFNAFGRNHY